MMRESRFRHTNLIRYLLVLLLFALGCAGAQRFDVTVNGLAGSRDFDGHRYVLLPADSAVDVGDLQFLDFARTVELGLADRGLVRMEKIQEADFSVLLSWSVGDRETRTIVFPGSTLASANFYSSHRHSRHCRHRGGRGYGAYYAPVYSAPTIVTVTTVNRLLSIEARALEAGKPARSGQPLWSTTVESRGSSDDLRRVFPVLVGAATRYFATDTGQRIETSIKEDDERVLRLKSARAELRQRSSPILEDPSSPWPRTPPGSVDGEGR